ncbi:MAG: hypothetical protein V4532_07920, partial [Pseudomonadota bacterium]
MTPHEHHSDLLQRVTIGRHGLLGDLSVPARMHGFVMFAHGSASSRKSPRNRLVAQVLQQHGLGTLLFDLLSEAEAAWRENVFQIAELAERNGIEVNVNFLEPTRLAHDARAQFSGNFLKPGKFFSCTTDSGPIHKRKKKADIVTTEMNRRMKRSLPYFETFRS